MTEEDIEDTVATTQADDESSSEERRHSGGPLAIDLPPDARTLNSALVLASDRNARINTLAQIVAEDPILSLELLRVANAMFYSGDRPSILNVRTAVVRLGSGSVVDALNKIKQRPALQPAEVAEEFEMLRRQSGQIAVVAEIVAGIAHRDLTELAAIAGLMTQMGHLIACAYFGERYLELVRSRSRASAQYKLQQDHNFDLVTIQLGYLRMRGIPQEVLLSLDKNAQCKTPAQAALRFIVQSSIELVDAYSRDQFDRYKKQGDLPSKSNLRLLKLGEHQYEEMIELVTAYLEAPEGEVARGEGLDAVPEAAEGAEGFAPTSFPPAEVPPPPPETPDTFSDEAKSALALIKRLCEESKNSQELLNNVMQLLITEGPYRRAALIIVGAGGHSAKLHIEVGSGFERGSTIPILDPVSPLAMCLMKVKSFNAQGIEDILSPFGTSAYALAPLTVSYPTPVLLYADCGTEKPLALESRKIFRMVMGLLNHVLPRLSGGLPKEQIRPTTTPSTFPRTGTDSVRAR